ncbi:MAG: FAD binding domain-containing protein [Lachnospiraceae bacterium]|nr:FAD binding domain-containing protein [Lachnospiraceae bacterium]
MYTIKHYALTESVSEAWELRQKGKNRVLAGGMWLRLGKGNVINTAIDLTQIGLDTIEEDDGVFTIGCMASLRQIEKHEALNNMCGGLIRDAVSSIVGTQFRNTATVGGSIYGRFGFSDVLTAFMVLDTQVKLHKGGLIPLDTFVEMPYDKDILTEVRVANTPCEAAYESLRLTTTDFPMINAAVSRTDGKWRIAVGARPMKARLLAAAENLSACPGEAELDALEEAVKTELNYGSNKLASADYRREMAAVLVRRAINRIIGEDRT